MVTFSSGGNQSAVVLGGAHAVVDSLSRRQEVAGVLDALGVQLH